MADYWYCMASSCQLLMYRTIEQSQCCFHVGLQLRYSGTSLQRNYICNSDISYFTKYHYNLIITALEVILEGAIGNNWQINACFFAGIHSTFWDYLAGKYTYWHGYDIQLGCRCILLGLQQKVHTHTHTNKENLSFNCLFQPVSFTVLCPTLPSTRFGHWNCQTS